MKHLILLILFGHLSYSCNRNGKTSNDAISPDPKDTIASNDKQPGSINIDIVKVSPRQIHDPPGKPTCKVGGKGSTLVPSTFDKYQSNCNFNY